MITAPTQDKKEYSEAIKGKSTPELTFNSFDGSNFGNLSKHSTAKLILRNNWLYLKNQLKEVRNPQTLFEVGDLYLLKGNYRRAIDHYVDILLIDPNSILAYEKIIFAYIADKKFEEAENYFKKLLKITDNGTDIVKRYALFKVSSLQISKAGQVNETLVLLQSALKKKPSDIELINTTGFVILNFKNDISVAKKYFTDALKIDPQYMHSLNNLGVCYMRALKFTEAESFLKKTLDINMPSYPYNYQNLASLYMAQNKLGEALHVLETAKLSKVVLESNWDHMIGWLLIKLDRLHDAKNWYLEKISVESDNDLLYNNLATCYRALGNQTEAERLYTKAIQVFKKASQQGANRDHRSLKAFYNLGRFAVDKGDLNGISMMANDILAIHKEDAFGIYLLGAGEVIRQNYDDAENLFKQALSFDTRIAEIYPDYSFILSSIKKDYKAAIKLSLKAISLNFKTPLIYNNLAYSYIKSGDLKSGEKILKEFKKLNGVINATKGLLEIRKGNIKEGNKYYDLALDELSKSTQELANQIKFYENARFYFLKGNLIKAKEFNVKAKNMTRSYMDVEISELEDLIVKDSSK